jgi:hypothetical protein
MKFRVTFKDPDGFSQSVQDYAKSLFSELPLTDEEKEDCVYKRAGVIDESLKKWVKYGEYITIEFDLVAKTAKVVET